MMKSIYLSAVSTIRSMPFLRLITGDKKGIQDGIPVGEVYCGQSMDTLKSLSINPLKNPGILLVGKMGMGKTWACLSIIKKTLLSDKGAHIFHVLDSSGKDNAIYKGLTDKTSSVSYSGSLTDACNKIDKLYEEFLARSAHFRLLGASDYFNLYNRHYELVSEFLDLSNALQNSPNDEKIISRLNWMADNNILLKGDQFRDSVREMIKDPSKANLVIMRDDFCGVAQIHLVIEDIAGLCKGLDFDVNSQTEGTSAYKLKMLARIGRSMGFNIIATNYPGASFNFPADIRVALGTVVALGPFSEDEAQLIKLPEAVKGKSHKRGQGVSESGSVEFPRWKKHDNESELSCCRSACLAR